jgi:hypothetical protein
MDEMPEIVVLMFVPRSGVDDSVVGNLDEVAQRAKVGFAGRLDVSLTADDQRPALPRAARMMMSGQAYAPGPVRGGE